MFKFRLQRVLELKEMREQASATRLSDARTGEEEARRRCADLEELRVDHAARGARVQTATPTIGQLQNLRFLVERLNDQIEQAYDDADAAERNVQQCMEEFTVAFKERKVLDRLRDRARDGWAAGEISADRELMDGIALTGFARARSAGNGSSAA
jgi:flagellar export protein FliJ